MSIEGQGHFLTLAKGHVHTKIQTGFSQKLLCQSEPGLICFVLYKAKISGERLQDHWSSGFCMV